MDRFYGNWKFEPLRGSPSRPLWGGGGGHARIASWGPSAPLPVADPVRFHKFVTENHPQPASPDRV